MTVKPVKRDPRSGHIIPHAAYEGWYPSELTTWGVLKLLAGPLIIAAVAYYALATIR